MDGQVARREDKDLAALMDKFVCVRIIQGYGIDLDLFQFDCQLSWSVFFMNSDKTIYGRYGTRSNENGMTDVSLDGFKKAVKGALDLHAAYPSIKQALAGKTGSPRRWKSPEAIPSLMKYKKGDTSRQGCIHCHKIQSGELTSMRGAGEAPSDRHLWTYPMPDTLGLKLDNAEMATVKDVAPGSAGEKAGFKAGDKVLRMNGQPLISISDVQWVLHNAAEPGEVKADVERGGKTVALSLPLKAGWRRSGEYTWRSTGWMLGNNIAGFRSDVLAETQRAALGLSNDALALKVRSIIPNWLKEGNQAVFKSGLAKNDVIVEVDGRKTALSESEFLAYLVQQKKPGETLELKVLRAGKEAVVRYPIK